jgi:1-aminocyclopropane-1-carboxylate deaminase/D-cysteine desulfhydrase-like pyridoxal-dependent ACC family enzyme
VTRRRIEPDLARLPLGKYPTALEHARGLSNPDADLWLKHDGRTHEVYGGNKVRKLEWLLADARTRGAGRLLTVGAAGSHHVLATTYFGRREGFAVDAVLVPQPRSDRAVEVLRASVALGLRPFPVQSWSAAAPALGWRLLASRDVRFVPLGGSSVLGSLGYVTAARELASQVRAGQMPEPDVCVVALGSGGTAAGLTAGFAAEGMKTRVVGVCVSRPPRGLRLASRALAWAVARKIRASCDWRAVCGRLGMDTRFLGRGYGEPAPEGSEAMRVAGGIGLNLDPTYTAKSFASALWYVRARAARVVLYWHTLSSAPMDPLLHGAPDLDHLNPGLRALLR